MDNERWKEDSRAGNLIILESIESSLPTLLMMTPSSLEWIEEKNRQSSCDDSILSLMIIHDIPVLCGVPFFILA